MVRLRWSEQLHKPISPKNGVGVFLWSVVSLKNMRMRFSAGGCDIDFAAALVVLSFTLSIVR